MDSQDRIKRLLNYKDSLFQPQKLGFVKVFSDNLADALGVSASLVRKDFANYSISGSQKGGYEIISVIQRINEILGKNKVQKIIIVGVGRLGSALVQFGKSLTDEGIKIIAGFDLDAKKIDENSEIPILTLDRMPDFIKDNNIEFAIVSVPEPAARQTIDLLKAMNIQGILNFTSLKVKSTEELIINNVNIEHELARLIYNVNNRNRKGD